MTMTTHSFSFDGISLTLELADGVFQPNLTTRLLAEVMTIPAGGRVLDLGCGVGPIAILAAKKGAAEVHAVDIMAEACAYARKNAAANGVADKVHVHNAHLFEGLDGHLFDVIIDDVSGMSEGVSRISPWYPESIPTGSEDGTQPTLDMLTDGRRFLKPGGVLYFPVLSLADAEKIRAHARACYGDHVECVAHKWVPFCDEFKENMDTMERMKAAGLIDYVTRRSRHLWRLEIYAARVPA